MTSVPSRRFIICLLLLLALSAFAPRALSQSGYAGTETGNGSPTRLG